MPWAAAGAVVSAGIGLFGSSKQASAQKAAQEQAQQQYQQQRADLAPFRAAAGPTLDAQNALLGLSGPDAADAAMANYRTSPGYQWQLGQGLRAVDAGAASKGLLHSGATIKGEQTFGAGLADSDFTSYYNRLMGITTLGENAAAGGAATASAAGSAALAGGDAQSSIYGKTASGLGSSVSGLFSNPKVQSSLNSLFSSPAPDYSAGLINQPGTSPGYGDQLFNSGGVF